VKIFNRISRLRNRFIEVITTTGLNSQNRSILLAMILGDKSQLEKDHKALFSKLGIMHLLAVSGLHLGLIFVVISKFLLLVGLPGHSPFNRLISILCVWAYGLLCGFPPSAVRAASMLSVYHLSYLLNRPAKGIHVIFLVAFLHTLLNPVALFSAGFQLSYLAVLGIIIYFKRISGLWQTSKFFLTRIRDLIALSLSAQTLTWPISIYLFAHFPTWFLLANLLLVPVGILIFYLGLFLTLMQFAGLESILIHRIVDSIMTFWIYSGSRLAEIPGGQMNFENFPWIFFIFFYSILVNTRLGVRKVLIRPKSLLMILVFWSLCCFFNIFVSNLTK
jgi:competence protein ComEC